MYDAVKHRQIGIEKGYDQVSTGIITINFFDKEGEVVTRVIDFRTVVRIEGTGGGSDTGWSARTNGTLLASFTLNTLDTLDTLRAG